MFTDEAPSHYRNDFERAAEAVEPYVFEDDGFSYLWEGCPEGLSTHYTRLISLGFANGWLS